MEIAGLIAIVWKIVDLIKYLTNRDWNAAITQLAVWASAIAVALLARESEPFSSIAVVGSTFAQLDTAAIILIGLGFGSAASGIVDFRKAIDSTDSAAVPALLPGPGPHHTVVEHTTTT